MRRLLPTGPNGRRPSGASLPHGPAVELLDAIRRGDWDGGLAMLPHDVEIAAPQFDTVISGADVPAHVRDALARFPDLTYTPHTRRAGPGVVVDDGFVTGTQTGGAHPTGRAMTTTVKVTAEHDRQQVTRLTVVLDPTALMRALGRRVDGSAALYSDLQTLRAGMHDGLTVHALTVPDPATATSRPTVPETTGRPGRRRGRLVAVGAALLVIGGAAAAQMTRDAPAPPSSRETPQAPVAAQTPVTATDPSPAPAEPRRTRKPSIVLSADLAFASNSAEVSPAARQRIVALTGRARGLTGVIRVDGYADNVGSAESGLVISLARATTVADILRAALRRDSGLTVRAVGHGESDPVASNATEDGRARNRRVTVTLPPG